MCTHSVHACLCVCVHMASMDAPVVEAVFLELPQSSEAGCFSSAVHGTRRLSPPSTLSPDDEPI